MKKLFFVLVLWLAGFTIAFASLYDVSIPVAAQDNATRDQALQQGLQSVLIQLSGNSQVNSIPAIANALKNPALYVDSYTFQTNPDSSQANLPYILQANFQLQAVNALLKSAGQTPWTAVRPVSLLWIEVQDNQGQRLLGADSGEALLTAAQTVAKQRDMPIIFPALDLTDLSQITPQDVADSNLPVIQSASQRYDHDVLIIAQITQNTDGTWAGQWEMGADSSSQQWKFTAKSSDELIAQGLNAALDAVAQHYLNVKAGSENKVTLTVTDINSLQDYAAINHYLKRISLIKQVTIQEVTASQIQFELSLVGTQKDLQTALNLADEITVLGPSDGVSAIPSQLTASWQAGS